MHSPEHVDELRLAFDAGAIRRDARLREDSSRVDDAIDLSDHSEGESPRARSGPNTAACSVRGSVRTGDARAAAQAGRAGHSQDPPCTLVPAWHAVPVDRMGSAVPRLGIRRCLWARGGARSRSSSELGGPKKKLGQFNGTLISMYRAGTFRKLIPETVHSRNLIPQA